MNLRLRGILRPAWFAAVFVALGLAAGAAVAAGAQKETAPKTPYESVDPLIGTAGGGNTFPGASLPFGMIQWSPDTGPDAWYRYTDHRIYGFSMTHLSGAGCPLYGDFPVLPITGQLTASPAEEIRAYTQPFSHQQEKAQPGYYAVTLADGVRVELTVTQRAGIARFYFPAGKAARLLINAGGSANSHPKPGARRNPAREQDGYTIRLDGSNAVEGSAHGGGFCSSPTQYTLYMYGEFKQPIVKSAMWNGGKVQRRARVEQGRHAGAWLDFGDQREVTMRVGLSYVSVRHAKANMQVEVPTWKFNWVRGAARGTWSDLLKRVEVEGGTPAERTIFYTGLYHMLLSPNIFSDYNGDYMGFDGKVHRAKFRGTDCSGFCAGGQYANFSDWDIYRDVIEMQALLGPAKVGDMAESLVRDAEQSGWLPRWPAANDVTYVMGGDSADVLLADAWAYGARNFDVKNALHFMVKGATDPGLGLHHEAERPFLKDELKLGYVAVNHDSIAASRSLEYASDDFAIAQLARAAGETKEAAKFMKRAGNWQTLFDPETKWIRPRNSDGTWLKGFNADLSLPKRPNAPVSSDQEGYEEGNAWQYSFMIPFDYPRLIAKMGGSQVVVPRLDRFFSKLVCWGESCFNMANEPDFVVPYTYEYTDAPWKTDEVVTRIEHQTFNATPSGIPGNDDLGATSGVYVWNALGLYPGVPGVGGMFVGTPMFPKATIHFAGGRTVEITRSGEGVYVTGLTLNGQPHGELWLPLKALPENATTTLHYTLQAAEPTATTMKAPPNFMR